MIGERITIVRDVRSLGSKTYKNLPLNFSMVIKDHHIISHLDLEEDDYLQADFDCELEVDRPSAPKDKISLNMKDRCLPNKDFLYTAPHNVTISVRVPKKVAINYDADTGELSLDTDKTPKELLDKIEMEYKIYTKGPSGLWDLSNHSYEKFRTRLAANLATSYSIYTKIAESLEIDADSGIDIENPLIIRGISDE